MLIDIVIGICYFLIVILLSFTIREIWLRNKTVRKETFEITKDTISSIKQLDPIHLSKRSDTLPKNYFDGDKVCNLPNNLKVYILPWSIVIDENHRGFIESDTRYKTAPFGTSNLPIMKIDDTIIVYLSEMTSDYKWSIGYWDKPSSLNVIFDETTS